MTINEYQTLASRTINKKLRPIDVKRHALFGLASEVGEILGLYQKHYQGHDINPQKIIEEGGDVLWMLAELFTVLGVSMEFVAEKNIKKLVERYPDGFDPERSLFRED